MLGCSPGVVARISSVRIHGVRNSEPSDFSFQLSAFQLFPRPSTPEAETNPHQYDGPPRTAEQVAA
jgi:hypothetical protein